MLTRDEFAHFVRDALNHLYDSSYLHAHPLAALLAESGSEPQLRSQALRAALLLAIRELHPPAGVPASSPDWRLYRILELRYIEGLSPGEAMSRLALEKSRFFQEQARGVEEVTSALWEGWLASGQPVDGEPDEGGSAELGQDGLIRREVERLLEQARWEPVDLASLLEQLRPIVEALAVARGAALTLQRLPELILPSADRVILRQVLLDVCERALSAAAGGRVEIGALGPGELGLRVRSLAGRHGRKRRWVRPCRPVDGEPRRARSPCSERRAR